MMFLQVDGHKKATKITGAILFFSLSCSAAFTVFQLISTQKQGVKGDRILTVLQCLLGLVVMLLPKFLYRKFNIVIPNIMVIFYYVFLFCAIYLGEVKSFYFKVPFWDDILHAFSGVMLGVFGFILVDLFGKNIKGGLSPFFISSVVFCFVVSVGVLWEIYEFSLDVILGLNMQKHTLENGVALMGNTALEDTMKDIIIDASSALFVALLGYFVNKRMPD